MVLPVAFLTTSQSDPDRLEARLRHEQEALFSLAQALTMSAEEAVRLVEQTYARAYERFADMPSAATGPALAALLLSEHGTARPHPEPVGQPFGHPAAPPAPEGMRQRLVDQFLGRALPGAFATLPTEHRLLLILCDVQGLACADAAQVVMRSPDEACIELAAARRALRQAVEAHATPTERQLLGPGLAEGWERAALRQMASTEFAPPPPSLRVVPPSQASAPEPAEPSRQARTESSQSLGKLLRQVMITLLVIVLAGALGYGFNAWLHRAPEKSALVLSVEKSRELELTLTTDSPEAAEQFVKEQLDWRLVLPGIDEAALEGVGVQELARGIEVPAFRFRDAATGETITVYAVTYALLDRHPRRLEIGEDVLRQIEEEEHFDVYDLGPERVLVWRYRDDIFIGVAPSSVQELHERIYFPS